MEQETVEILYRIEGKEREQMDALHRAMVAAKQRYDWTVAHIWEREDVPLTEGVEYRPTTGQFIRRIIPKEKKQ